MKKNFLMVAALLIAAMLLVVSCTQEVAPKNDGLVEAKLGLAYGKDVTVGTADGEVITYTYKLTPMWSGVDNSTEIYGNQVETAVDNGRPYSVSATVRNVDMGLVTPGLWKITVRGYTGYNSITDKGKEVLFGENNAYFVNGSSNATVIVSPTTSVGVGTVDISLEMQDLGDDTKNAIEFTIHNVTKGEDFSTDVKLVKEDSNDEKNESGVVTETDKKVFAYKAKLNNVPAGYNTITFTTPSAAGAGGIVKTFLVIPGNTVTIRGSVSPSEFQTAKADIVTVSMSGASLSITDETVDVDDNDMYSLNMSTDYTFEVNTNTILTTIVSNLPEGATEKSIEYVWYVNGVEKKRITGDDDKTYTFNQSAPGDYTVTCTFKYYFELDDSKYTWIGDASLGKIRVTE